MLYYRVIGHVHTYEPSGVYLDRRYGGVRRNHILHRQVVVYVSSHPQVARRHVNVDVHRQMQGDHLKHVSRVSALMGARVNVNVSERVCMCAVC